MRPVAEHRQYGERIPLTCWQGYGLDFIAHWHPEVELCLVTEGRLRMGINGTVQDLEPGWIGICGSNDIHYYQRLDTPVRHIILIFRPELIDYPGIWPRSGRRVFHPFWPPGSLNDVLPLLRFLADSDRSMDDFQKEIDRGVAIQLCGFLDRHATVTSPSDQVAMRADWRSRMIHAIEFIRTHSSENIGLRDVASAVNLSPWYFSRNFAISSGQTFTTYLHGVRLAQADELLASGDKTILEIALACGFGSVRSFNRAWRKIRGTTPAHNRGNSESSR